MLLHAPSVSAPLVVYLRVAPHRGNIVFVGGFKVKASLSHRQAWKNTDVLSFIFCDASYCRMNTVVMLAK